MRVVLAVVGAAGALLAVFGVLVYTSMLTTLGGAVALGVLAGYAGTAGGRVPKLVRWPLVLAVGGLAVALVVAFAAEIPQPPTEEGLAYFGCYPRPHPRPGGVLRAAGDGLRAAAPLLAWYGALVVAVAALPRYRRPRLAVAGVAAVLLAPAYAYLLGSHITAVWRAGGLAGPAPMEVAAVMLGPTVIAVLPLAGAALASQRIPDGRSRAVPVALVAAALFVLAIYPLQALETASYGLVLTYGDCPPPGDLRHEQAAAVGITYGSAQPAIGSAMLAIAWLAALAVVVWGCLRAAWSDAPAEG
jgi:hypothetical protein